MRGPVDCGVPAGQRLAVARGSWGSPLGPANRATVDRLVAFGDDRRVVARGDALAAARRVDRRRAAESPRPSPARRRRGSRSRRRSRSRSRRLRGRRSRACRRRAPRPSPSRTAPAQRIGIRNAFARANSSLRRTPADLADEHDLPAVDVRLDLAAEVLLLPGLHRSGEHEPDAGRAAPRRSRDARPWPGPSVPSTAGSRPCRSRNGQSSTRIGLGTTSATRTPGGACSSWKRLIATSRALWPWRA